VAAPPSTTTPGSRSSSPSLLTNNGRPTWRYWSYRHSQVTERERDGGMRRLLLLLLLLLQAPKPVSYCKATTFSKRSFTSVHSSLENLRLTYPPFALMAAEAAVAAAAAATQPLKLYTQFKRSKKVFPDATHEQRRRFHSDSNCMWNEDFFQKKPNSSKKLQLF